MKKWILVLFMMIFFLQISALFAQQDEEIKSVYVKNFLILKIYTHYLGYKVVYWTSDMETAAVYIPMSWFDSLNRKAMVVYGKDAAYPYLSVIWVNGKISLVKIYAFEDTNHYSWGVLKDSPDLESKFNVQDLDLKY
jgi:hypothetical protein